MQEMIDTTVVEEAFEAFFFQSSTQLQTSQGRESACDTGSCECGCTGCDSGSCSCVTAIEED